MSKLNNRILKAKGYRLQLLESKQFGGVDGLSYRIALVAPDNVQVHSAWYTSPDDFDKVANHVYDIGKLPGLDFEHDMNAAMLLMKDCYGKIVWDVSRWELVVCDGDYPVYYGGDAARLICEA